MDAPGAWWLALAGALAVGELLTGTFYLLMLALAAVATAGVAHFVPQVSAGAQLAGFAALALALCGGWMRAARRRRPSHPKDPGFEAGEVVALVPGSVHGLRARVAWRGTQWDAELLAPPDGAVAARLVRQDGNRLVVAPVADQDLQGRA